MVSHPETGLDSPIGSDRDRGRDTEPGKNSILTKISLSQPKTSSALFLAFPTLYCD